MGSLLVCLTLPVAAAQADERLLGYWYLEEGAPGFRIDDAQIGALHPDGTLINLTSDGKELSSDTTAKYGVEGDEITFIYPRGSDEEPQRYPYTYEFIDSDTLLYTDEAGDYENPEDAKSYYRRLPSDAHLTLALLGLAESGQLNEAELEVDSDFGERAVLMTTEDPFARFILFSDKRQAFGGQIKRNGEPVVSTVSAHLAAFRMGTAYPDEAFEKMITIMQESIASAQKAAD
ncbi:hypothetical protein ACFOW6_12660 [Fodinicurvata halophila]|uniref:Uncharacterized protein n=1 Tax=Fodinicurvata halophila TaxID=1419723 RepID=A0ABV8UPJ3_9PROT